MTIELSIMKPFSEEKKQVEWVFIECPGGNFTIGVGHRPLVNILTGNKMVVYRQQGSDYTVEVPAEGGMIHVYDNQVVLFLS